MAEKNTAVIGFEKQIWDWLLHGRSDFEIEEIECVRLFNAVHSLCMVINKEAKENI